MVDPRRANPFIGALWVLSPAAIAASLAVIVSAQFQLYRPVGTFGVPNEPSAIENLLSQMAHPLGSAALAAGLLGIIGLLFWHAFAWRRGAIAQLAAESAPRD